MIRRVHLALLALTLAAPAFGQGSSGNVPVTVGIASYAPMPSGGDDVVALQAWIDGLPNNGIGYLPTGTYNVCATHLALPTTVKRIALIGTGTTTIRIKPDCAAPPNQLLYLKSPPNGGQYTYISGINWDGRCLVKYVWNFVSGHGVIWNDGLVKNAKGNLTGSANIKLGDYTDLSGRSYEHIFRTGARIDNNNEDGLTCYSNLASFPDYNLNLQYKASDSTFERIGVVNAAIANVYDDSGGSNAYFGTHAWNYFNSNDPALNSPYNFYVVNHASLYGVFADSGRIGIFMTGVHPGAQVIGGRYIYGLPGGAQPDYAGVVIDTNVRGSIVTGFQANDLRPSRVVVQNGTAHPSTVVSGNGNALYTAPGAQAIPSSAAVNLAINGAASGRDAFSTVAAFVPTGSYVIPLNDLYSAQQYGAISTGNAGIPDGAAIVAIDGNALTVTLSKPTTAPITAGATLTFDAVLALCPTSQGGGIYVRMPFTIREGCIYLPATGLTALTDYYIYADLKSFQVTGAADNGITSGPWAHAVRLTVTSTAGLQSGSMVRVEGFPYPGTLEANGARRIAVIDGTHVDLYGSTFANAYTFGGEINTLTLSASTVAPIQLISTAQGAGVQVKGDDPTKTLVGFARVNTGPMWTDRGAPDFKRWVRSWYNPTLQACELSLGTTQTPAASTSYQKVGASQCSLLTWGAKFRPALGVRGGIWWNASGAASNSTAGAQCTTGVGIDDPATAQVGTSTGTSSVAGQLFPVAVNGTIDLFADPGIGGVHEFILIGKSPSGACSWDGSTSLHVHYPG